jgi:glycosyltransferase involved in cell wall biosynthesis
MNEPQVSVVVPTRNRVSSVRRLLRALAVDTTAPAFEVVVVDDGSTDGTVEALRQLQLPYSLTIVERHDGGPASARNAGARVATGRVLLFLDDDVEPCPGTLAAHAQFHRDSGTLIGIGDLPVIFDGPSFFQSIVRGWWAMMLIDIRKPGHRVTFKNLLTGHVSIRRSQFDALGGFDPALRCHEDWEFGYRGLLAGLDARLVPGAVARHHETTDLRRVLQRKFDEGVADIQLTRRYPELARALLFAWPLESKKARGLKRLIFVAPSVADSVARRLERLLPVYERVKLRFRWRQTLELLLAYHYWRGIRSVLPNRHDVSALINACPEPAADPMVIDLAGGVDAAATRIDQRRPSSMVLMLGDELVGNVPALAGAERLRGEHLRPLLARPLRAGYLRALARRGAIPEVLRPLDPLSDQGRTTTRASAPLVRDQELGTAQVAAGTDMQHRAAVPPIHDVA